MARQLRLIDGWSVDEFQAKFPGTITVDEADVDALGMDDSVVMVIVASVGAVHGKRIKDGGLRRIVDLTVTQARVAKGEQMEDLLDTFGFEFQEQLPLGSVGAPSGSGSSSGPSTVPTAGAPSDPDDDEEEEDLEDDPEDEDEDLVSAGVGSLVQRSAQSSAVSDPALAAFVTEGAQ